MRLCKAQRLRYKNNDMADLRAKLEEAAGARIKLIATDGVFSMDGIIANLPAICDLAEEYGALVMVDDSHAVGLHGRTRARHAGYAHVEGRVDILTGTFGKALGGASGGYTAASKTIVNLLRQKSRPYLFSNTGGSGGVRRDAEDARPARNFHRPARQTGGQHRLLPRRTAQGGPHRAGRANIPSCR